MIKENSMQMYCVRYLCSSGYSFESLLLPCIRTFHQVFFIDVHLNTLSEDLFFSSILFLCSG